MAHDTANVNNDYDPDVYWSEVGRFIDERADHEDVFLAGDDEPFDRHKRKKFIVRLLHRGLEVANRSVLEVGCGPGGNLIELAGAICPPARIAGVDVSQQMVDLASRFAPGAEVTKIDGRRLPFADNEFDVVFSATVLMHNTDPVIADLIGEMCRVAKRRVVLFEEVARAHRRERYSFVKRPVSHYARFAGEHGWELVETAFLYHQVLQRACRGQRKILNPRAHEGAPRRELSRKTERALVSTLWWVDDVVRWPAGLARMTFAPSPSDGPIPIRWKW